MKKFLQRHSQVKKYAFILLIAIEFLRAREIISVNSTL